LATEKDGKVSLSDASISQTHLAMQKYDMVESNLEMME
jgi:hypothetical protein